MKYRYMKNLHAPTVFIPLLLFMSGCINSDSPVNIKPDDETKAVQVFEGQYTSNGPIINFEETMISSFIPSGMDETPGAGNGYWLVPNDEFIRLYNKETEAMIGAIATTYGPCDVLVIRAKFEGILSPPITDKKGYGFSELYEREVKVTKVLEIKYFWTGISCPPTLSAFWTQAALIKPPLTLTPTP